MKKYLGIIPVFILFGLGYVYVKSAHAQNFACFGPAGFFEYCNWTATNTCFGDWQCTHCPCSPPQSGYEWGYQWGYEGGYEYGYEGGYENGYESSYQSSYESSYESGYPADPTDLVVNSAYMTGSSGVPHTTFPVGYRVYLKVSVTNHGNDWPRRSYANDNSIMSLKGKFYKDVSAPFYRSPQNQYPGLTPDIYFTTDTVWDGDSYAPGTATRTWGSWNGGPRSGEFGDPSFVVTTPGNYIARFIIDPDDVHMENLATGPLDPTCTNTWCKYNFKNNQYEIPYTVYEPTYSVSGEVYEDKDNSNSLNAGDAPIPGAHVYLQQGANSPSTRTTDVNGKYDFGQRKAATYSLSVQPPLPFGYKVTSTNPQTITIGPDNVTNFAMVKDFKSIKGTVFVDTNQNNQYEPGAGDTPYTDNNPIPSIAYDNGAGYKGTVNASNGIYTFPNLPVGTYKISYTNPPGGNFTIYPGPPSFQVTIGQGCTFTAAAKDAACDASGNITGLNFSLTENAPWIQNTGLDLRFDGGLTNKISQNPACTPFTSIVNSTSSPGVVYVGNSEPKLGQGQLSVDKWKVGGIAYPDKFSSSQPVRSSYASLLATINKSGQSFSQQSGLPGCSNLSQCSVNGGASGAYKFSTNTSVTLTDGAIPNGTQIILLVDGDVTITKPITVAKGGFFMVVSSGSILVDKSVGIVPDATSCTAPAQVEGVYVANYSFVVQHDTTKTCPASDLMLIIGGSVIVNASRAGGGFINNRSLCSNNSQYPVVRFNERTDFILSAPDYIKSTPTVWQEIAP